MRQILFCTFYVDIRRYFMPNLLVEKCSVKIRKKPKNLENMGFSGRKTIMIKILFICHGRTRTFV